MKFDFQKLGKKLKIYNGAEALAAALFSVLLTAGVLFALEGALYNKWPVYDELVVGNTTWDGYYKKGDMIWFYLIYVLLPVFFCFFIYIKHTFFPMRQPNCRRTGKKAAVEKERVRQNAAYDISYPVCILLGLEAIKAFRIAGVGIAVGKKDIIILCSGLLVIVFAVAAIIAPIIFRIRKKDMKAFTKKCLLLFQLLLPFQFLGFYQFYYEYEGAEDYIRLFASARWKGLCLLLFIVFLGYQAFCVFKKKEGIYLSTLIMLAMGSVAKTPEGIASVDFFHMGEMAMPMQQLLSYGKIPYFDLDPIHGFCDFLYSAFNVVFFDGSYLGQSAGIVTAEFFMAAVLAAVIGKCVSSRYAAFFTIFLLMPFLTEKAGARYFIFFVMFFVLFSERVRADSRRFLWWWVLLCILGISWNVSIGSSAAVAFLPEVIYRLVKDIFPSLCQIKQWEKKERRKFLTAYGALIVLGVCYIPLFLQILNFLSENAGTTLYVNGSAVFGEEFYFLGTYGFIVPYLLFMIYALWGSRKGKAAFLSMLFCLFVISNYACVRYDESIRLTVLAVFFTILFLTRVCSEREEGLQMGIISKGMSAAAGVLLLVCLAWYQLPLINSRFMEPEEIPAQLEMTVMGEESMDPVVYVSGESVDMPELGTGFIRGSTLNSLKNVKAVLDAETTKETYLDLTNKIAHYVILDKETELPFTSAYNISNQRMQENAVTMIKENPPAFVLLSPLIQFDLCPVSLRSMKFYTELIRMGYQPYVYGDAVYLLHGDSGMDNAVDGKRSLGLITHKEYMGMLPYIWGSSMEADKDAFDLEKIEISYEFGVQDGIQDQTLIQMEQTLDGTEVSYIKLVADKEQVLSDNLCVRFQSTVDSEEHQFVFLNGAKKDRDNRLVYLLPVGSSAFWQYSDMTQLWLEGIEAEAILELEFYR